MKYKIKNKAILLLEDGTIFYGFGAGFSGIATGELCFNTGMTGYQEVFTDPSYYGQLMITTNAHIGNYGVKDDEIESEDIKISGLICKNFNSGYSRQSADSDLNTFFKNSKKVVITDIDTRAVVRHIRDKGAMNAIISNTITDITELLEIIKSVPSMVGLELCSKVSTNKSYYLGNKESNLKVAVLDLGVKKNILKCLTDRNCFLKIFPMNSSYKEINAWGPDGFFLSNGPGDPDTMPQVLENIKSMTRNGKPVFGICLGHQMLALSEGVGTYKMHNGHRGINHPVQNLKTGKSEVTSQNHGFGINAEDVNSNNNISITHINLNDNTIEGIELKDKNCFSVQYHPESSPGPHDSRYLFDEFINRMMTLKK